MASPPFNINQLVPQDNDIASQFPATERTFRDVVESWFLIDGNVSGRKNKVGFDFQGSDPAGTADVTTVWADADGDLKLRVGTAAIQSFGVPSGAIMDYAGATAPEGWLFPYGQAVSRTTYGAGDGSTTFNLPDYRGRVGAGQDDMGGSSANRLTGLSGGVEGDTLGAVGGAESHTLTEAQLAEHDHAITDPGHTHDGEANEAQNSASGVEYLRQNGTFTRDDVVAVAMTGITVNNAGGGAAHNNVQPTIILNKIIKI
jgi:microcystin-dependent protein